MQHKWTSGNTQLENENWKRSEMVEYDRYCCKVFEKIEYPNKY